MVQCSWRKAIAATAGSNAAYVKLDSLNNPDLDRITVYVSEVGKKAGSFGPSSANCRYESEFHSYGQIFTVLQPLVLDSLSFEEYYETELYTVRWWVEIYNTGRRNGATVALKEQGPIAVSDPVGQPTYTFDVTSSPLHQIPVDITLQPGTYALFLQNHRRSNILKASFCNTSLPVTDNPTNPAIRIDTFSIKELSWEYPVTYNWKFHTIKTDPDTLPVVLTKAADCILTAVEETTGTDEKISPKPNPFSVEVEIESNDIKTIEVFSATGALIEEHNNLTGAPVKLGNSWKKGIYRIRVNRNSSYTLLKE